VEDSIFMDGL